MFQSVVFRVGKNPYDYKPKPNEDMKEYFRRLTQCIKLYMDSEEMPLMYFNKPVRKAHVVLTNLPDHPPYSAIKRRFGDVFINGIPHTEEYETEEIWILTMDILKKLAIKSQRDQMKEVIRAQDQITEREVMDIPTRVRVVIDRPGLSTLAPRRPTNQARKGNDEDQEEGEEDDKDPENEENPEEDIPDEDDEGLKVGETAQGEPMEDE